MWKAACDFEIACWSWRGSMCQLHKNGHYYSMSSVNRKRPSIDPCGTPLFIRRRLIWDYEHRCFIRHMCMKQVLSKNIQINWRSYDLIFSCLLNHSESSQHLYGSICINYISILIDFFDFFFISIPFAWLVQGQCFSHLKNTIFHCSLLTLGKKWKPWQKNGCFVQPTTRLNSKQRWGGRGGEECADWQHKDWEFFWSNSTNKCRVEANT